MSHHSVGQRLLAWQDVLPEAACVTHLSSARMRGWWLPPLPSRLPEFVAIGVEDARIRRQGLSVTRHPASIAWEHIQGVRCATAGETVMACARDLGLLDVVVLMDSALHLGHATRDELDAIAQRRRRGAPRMRAALALADGRAESPWESLLRILHVCSGVEVEPQHELFDERGAFVARGDLWLPGTRVFHEYDGGEHRRQAQQRKDLKRDRRIGHADWLRRGYTADDVLHQGVAILRDADLSVGREHDPSRIRRWHALLRESCFTPPGRVRLSRRLRIEPGSGHSASDFGAESVTQ